MNAHILAKTLKGTRRKKPWIDRKVRTAIRKKARLYTRMKKTKKEKDIRKYRQRGRSKTRKTGLLFICK